MKKQNILKASVQVLFALLLILVAVYLYSGPSTGWFASNKDVDGSGMGVSAKGIHLEKMDVPMIMVTRDSTQPGKTQITKASTAQDWNANCLLPGDRITVMATLYTTADTKGPVTVQFSLQTPDQNGDAAVTDGQEKDWYLSDYMYITGAEVQIGSNRKQAFLPGEVKLSDHTPGSTVKLGGPQTLDLTGSGGKCDVIITMELRNENINQSILRGFLGLDVQPAAPSSFRRDLIAEEILN